MSAGVPCMHCISRRSSDAGRTPSGQHADISSRGHSCACSFSDNQAEQSPIQLYTRPFPLHKNADKQEACCGIC